MGDIATESNTEFLAGVISAREATITEVSGDAGIMRRAIWAFLAALADGTGPGGMEPVIARRDLLESPLVQALADAADGRERVIIANNR